MTDAAISALLLETLAPAALEAALAVQDEIAGRIAQAEAMRRSQVERARYDAELARRRYLQVDPDHRLVADALEADWNTRLRPNWRPCNASRNASAPRISNCSVRKRASATSWG